MYRNNKGPVASIKVLVELFQKLAGVEGTASPSDRRNGRNTLEFEKVPLFAFLHLLVNALLAKGEKEEMNSSNQTKGLLHFGIFFLSATGPCSFTVPAWRERPHGMRDPSFLRGLPQRRCA